MSLSAPINTTLAPLAHPQPSTATIREDRSLRHFSDEAVTSYIYTKHRDDDKVKIDVDDFVAPVESIITTADRISETRFSSTEGRSIFSDDFLKANVVDLPICTLHHISSELAIKAPGIEKAHRTTLDILDILTSNPLEAKAFMETCGTSTTTPRQTQWRNRCLLSGIIDTHEYTNLLVKWNHRRVAVLKKQMDSIKYRQVLLSPNSLIHGCLRVVKYMNQLNFQTWFVR